MRYRAYLSNGPHEWDADLELEHPPANNSIVVDPQGRQFRVTHLLDPAEGYDGALVADQIRDEE